jgi:hypothetical protein
MSDNAAEAVLDEPDFAEETFAGADEPESSTEPTIDRGDVVADSTPEPVEEAVEPAPEETEAESEPGAEAEAEPETEAVAEESNRDAFQIPKSRLDKEIARKKALQNQVEELQRRLDGQQNGVAPQQSEFVFEGGDDPRKMFDKVLEGDLDTANDLFSSMVSKAVNAGITSATQGIETRVRDQVKQVQRQQTEGEVAEQLENTYDFYRADSDDYDEGLVEETLAIRDSFINRGYEPADAMRQAADYVIRVNKPELIATQEAVAPAQQTRNPNAVQKNVAAANQQPPSLPTSTQGSKAPPEIDLSSLSIEEFDALPKATLARLRGDTF